MGYESVSIAEKMKNSAAQTLSWAIDTTEKQYGLPIVLFNSHAFEVEEVVEINNSALSVRAVDGKEVPFANVTCEALPVFNRDNAIFKAKVPAMGYAVYYFEPTGEFNRVDLNKPFPALNNTDIRLENEKLCVQFDDKGNLISLFNKQTGKETLQGRTRAVIIDEAEHDTWSHGKNYFNKELGEAEFVKAEKLESNDIRETIKVTAKYGDSTIAQDYTLNAGDDMVRVKVKLNWNEKHKMLKFAFPVNSQNPTSLYEIPFGSVERPCNGEEESALMWAMVGGEDNGLAILNDCKYSYSANGNELALTAIRSPIYCDHGLTRTVESNYTDQGLHEFEYAIMPATTGERAKIFRRALAFNHAVTVVMENHHKGVLPLTYEGIAVDKENIVVSAFKRSEDGKGYVLRAYEVAGKQTDTLLDCKTKGKLQTSFAPYEVKTFFIGETGRGTRCFSPNIPLTNKGKTI
jgi:alpha-mannosidase